MSDIKQQLQEQLAEITWKELKPHAERSALIIVDQNLDLVEVGYAIAQDNAKVVQNWISEQLIQKPTAQQLDIWNENENQMFKTIIVNPFVLISPID